LEEPLWLDDDDVINVHQVVIDILGRPGFPHPGYLSSAVFAPRQHWHYTNGGGDLFDLAAIYLYHIAKAHAFTDGNKRSGYASALLFLTMNGINLILPKNMLELAQATEAAAAGKLERAELARILRGMPHRPED
jgi:death on curing protein